jgi:glycosyltransferase involved in cell wall biosynthesis
MAIKVLHLIDSGGLYGAEMMLLNLVEEQVKLGLKPLILSAGIPDIKEKALESEAKKRGLPVKSVRMKAGVNPYKAFQIIKFANREGFDVMHAHGYKFNILIGMMPKFIRKIPFMTTLHGYTGVSGFSKMRVYQTLERVLLSYIDGIVYVSNEIKKNPILKGFSAKKEAVILNGINASKIISGASDNKAASIQDFFPDEHGNCIYIGAIGRLSQEKGFDLLIDAFSDLVISNPNLRLIIIGEGALRSQLEHKISTYALQNKIKLPGFISPVYRLMKDLDGLVMPSYTEGLPITLLEACILNLSIVASRVGSIEEVLSGYKSSIVVSPGNVSQIKEAVSKLIIDENGKEVSVGSWSSAAFDPKTMSKKYAEFYSQLIDD